MKHQTDVSGNEAERGAAGRPIHWWRYPHSAGEAYPWKQSEDGAGMREEGDRIEGDAPGLPGAVRARWLHPSGFLMPDSSREN